MKYRNIHLIKEERYRKWLCQGELPSNDMEVNCNILLSYILSLEKRIDQLEKILVES